MKTTNKIARMHELKRIISRLEKKIDLTKKKKVNRVNRYYTYRKNSNYINSSYMTTDIYFIDKELNKLNQQLLDARQELKNLKRVF